MASMGLAAVGHHRLGPLTLGGIFMTSDRIGKAWSGLRSRFQPDPLPEAAPFNIL